MKPTTLLILILLVLPTAQSHAEAPSDTKICPVTIASDFGMPEGIPAEDIWGTGLIHNGEVGVMLAHNGAITLREDMMGEKISWWTKDHETNLTASARNAHTGEEITEIGLTPYATYLQGDGGVILMSGITFPSTGCWELIATGDDSELQVTVLVITTPPSPKNTTSN